MTSSRPTPWPSSSSPPFPSGCLLMSPRPNQTRRSLLSLRQDTTGIVEGCRLRPAALLSPPSELITPWQVHRTTIAADSFGVCSERRRVKMQLHGEPDLEASQAAVAKSSLHKRNSPATRKVTIRITEEIHKQLEAATERPGVGKSMVVEAALAQFLNPRPPENPVQHSSDDIH